MSFQSLGCRVIERVISTISPLPRPLAQHARQDPLYGAGLATVLDTHDFGSWEAAVADTLEHHSSELLTRSESFGTRIRSGQLGDCMLVHIQGRGRLRLNREQCHQSVLWLPLRGMTTERINGREWLAEPSDGLLFRPGDAMEGETSEEIEGISILLPPDWLPETSMPIPPLLAAGVHSQAVLRQARHLVPPSPSSLRVPFMPPISCARRCRSGSMDGFNPNGGSDSPAAAGGAR